jgi:hypothetical protein
MRGGLGGGHGEVKLHEPVVIQQLRHPFQLRVDLVVQLDLRVEGVCYGGNLFL